MPTAKASDAPAPSANDLLRILKIKNAEGWRPEAEDMFTGKLVSIRKGGEDSEYGIYPIFVYEIDNEFRAVHAFHTIIQAQYADIKRDHGLKLGDTHTVYYGGKGVSRKRVTSTGEPQTYHNYTVIYGDGSDANLVEFEF